MDCFVYGMMYNASAGCHCERNVKPECVLEGYKYDFG